MRVALDATPLIGPRTGVGHYVAGLIDGLLSLPRPPEVVLTAFTLRGRGRLVAPRGAVVAGRPAPARLLQASWMRGPFPPVELLSGRADVFHATNFVLPPRARAAGVVMVHDLAYEKLPEVVTAASLRYRQLVPKALLDPRVVVTTPTEAVADEVADFYRIDRGRVVATPLGVADEWYGARPAEASWLAARQLPSRYLLFVGSLEPRKNLGVLLKAHAAAQAENADVPTLLLVGPPGWGEAVESRSGVVATGYLPHDQLRSLVAGAVAVTLPSRYEGFGLPLLEAFACGTPVIAGRVPALQEVSAGLAPIVDPDDVDALAHQLVIASTTQDDDVARKARTERARAFTLGALCRGEPDRVRAGVGHPAAMSAVLLVEDDGELAAMLQRLLHDEGYEVVHAPDGHTALHVGLTQTFDALIVDRGLPAVEGLDLLSRLRGQGIATPALILSARGTVADRIAGLDAGAEDYLTKPFDVDELLARVRALLRRHTEESATLSLGTRVLDIDARVVRSASDPARTGIALSERETVLLTLLARRPSRVFSRAELLERVFTDAESEVVVDTYVHYVRRKLGRGTIRTVRGVGYQLGST